LAPRERGGYKLGPKKMGAIKRKIPLSNRNTGAQKKRGTEEKNLSTEGNRKKKRKGSTFKKTRGEGVVSAKGGKTRDATTERKTSGQKKDSESYQKISKRGKTSSREHNGQTRTNRTGLVVGQLDKRGEGHKSYLGWSEKSKEFPRKKKEGNQRPKTKRFSSRDVAKGKTRGKRRGEDDCLCDAEGPITGLMILCASAFRNKNTKRGGRCQVRGEKRTKSFGMNATY